MNTDTFTSLHRCLEAAFPPVTLELLREAAAPEPNFARLADVIAMDPAIAAAVLNLVNSPYYGLSSKITDIKHAVVTLGSQEILKLALSVSFHDALHAGQPDSSKAYHAWRLTVFAASAAELLAERLEPDSARQAYVCALLKDLALHLIMRLQPGSLPQDFAEASLVCLDESRLSHESQALGVNHAAMTADLLQQWSLPVNVCIEAIRRHHDFHQLDRLDPLSQCLILATRWSELELGCPLSPAPVMQFQLLLAARLGIQQDEVEALRATLTRRYRAMLTTLRIGESEPTERYYQHSLQEMQLAYFLSMDVVNVSGGLTSVAEVFARHMKWHYGVEAFDLLLRRPVGQGLALFTKKEGGDMKTPGKSQSESGGELSWTQPGPAIPLTAAGQQWGEMRLPPRLPADVRARVTLYGKFFSQAYDQYANRQAVLELKAQTLDNLPVGVARLDDEGVILEANPKLHDFLQMSAASSGVHLLDRLAERWGFPLCEEWRGMIEQGERQVASTVFCPPPEGGEPGRCYYLALHRLAGHDVQHLFILEDVTDVSQLDMQALQRRDFLERLVGSMRDLVLVMGPSGRIRYASREDRALMGKNLFSISRPISDKDITWAPETLPDLDHPIEIYIDLGVKRPVPMELAISAMSGPTASGVESYLAVGRDLTRIRTLERRIRRLAVFDPLTDLYNRGQCFAILSNESNRARRLGTSLAVLFFELDDFENAVATYGFKHGDDLCIALADVMRQNSREGMDYACRVAEEQFALIVTQIPLDKLSPIAGRFLESYTKATAEGGEPGMTLSCGIAVWQADEDAEETLHRARIAARKASQSGGNKVVLGQRPD